MRVKHVQYRNIQIYFCNIPMKQLQHYFKTFETRETCNMQQTLTKTEEDGQLGSSRHRRSSLSWRSHRQGSSHGLMRRYPGALPRRRQASSSFGMAAPPTERAGASLLTERALCPRRTRPREPRAPAPRHHGRSLAGSGEPQLARGCAGAG